MQPLSSSDKITAENGCATAEIGRGEGGGWSHLAVAALHVVEVGGELVPGGARVSQGGLGGSSVNGRKWRHKRMQMAP